GGLRLDDAAVTLVIREQAAGATPLVDLFPPAGNRLGVRCLADFLDDGNHLGQYAVHRANDRDVGLDRLGDGGWVDVDMNDLGVRAELRRAVDHPVIEARTDCQNHVGMVHGQVGGVTAVHAEHADELTVAAGERTQAHQRIGYRQVEHFRQLGELSGGVAHDHAAAGIDDRTLGREQKLCRLADLAGVATHGWAVGAQLGLFRVDVLVFLGRVGHILRDIDDNRAWTTGFGKVERLLHHFGDFRRMLDHEAVLHDRPGDADHVGLLEGIGADHVARYLAGDDHHRDRV